MRSVSRLRSIRLTVLAAVNALIAFHVLAYYVLDARSIGCVDFFGLLFKWGTTNAVASRGRASRPSASPHAKPLVRNASGP